MNKKQVMAGNLAAVYTGLQSSENGLSTQEARIRFAKFGKNLMQKKTVNAVDVLKRQFQNVLIYLLVSATIISFVIGDYSDGIIILIIIVLNTILGFYQEYKSEKIIEKLSNFITKVMRVKRDGQMMLLNQSEIVPGDIVVLREGDIAPADMRLINAENAQVNESSLTGESMPVLKRVNAEALTTDESLVFTGSIIEKGEVTGVVYATGADTEFGAIVTLTTETKKDTEYERSLKLFSSFLLKVVLYSLTVIFFAKIFLNRGSLSIVDLLIFMIAMAILVVPEVLPVIATISLSSGALKLAKKHVVVKRLSSVEDLGNISVLCTDKTGTITENKMVVQNIVATDRDLFQIFAYATIAILKNRKRRTDSSYDDAFINYIPQILQDKAKEYCIVKELPFDPDDKRRRVVLHNTVNNKYFLIIIGAPDIVLGIAKSIDMAGYLHTISEEGKTGLHHLALAYKEIIYSADYDILANEKSDLLFLGYVGFVDPLRESAKRTIEHAEKLGIKIKILTGDSKEVAEYIGREVGLVDSDSVVYLGEELEAMSPSAFKEAVINANVFARVSPTQKFNIIKALKEAGYVVGYQGDGINDAPALKLADVAIAVNSATDIAKEDADIVLLNRDLEVIINGIKYGRTIFVNINKYIKYTMVNNFGSFMALAVLYLFSKNLPLLPIQVLLTNILTDIPLVTIYSDTVEDADVINPEKNNIRELLFISLILGIPTALFELLYYMVIRFQPTIVIQTGLFLFFTFTALIVFYAFRNNGFFWKVKKPSLLLNTSFFLTFLASLAITYVPFFQHIFHFTGLSWVALGTIIVAVLVYFFSIDLMKTWYYRSSVLVK
ncbi:MAG: cation-transporting P-type ATPase [Candidatus Paceibacterota bacterium]